MATIRLPILDATSLPDDSGFTYFETFAVKATNDFWKHLVLIFTDSSTKISIYGTFIVPKNYVGSPKIIVYWTSTATSGDVEFDWDHRAVAIGEGLDQATAQASVNQNDTAPGTALDLLEAELTLTAANFAADDIVEWKLSRDGTDGGDTMAASAIIFAVGFEYADA